jgi:hypothetical protein
VASVILKRDHPRAPRNPSDKAGPSESPETDPLGLTKIGLKLTERPHTAANWGDRFARSPGPPPHRQHFDESATSRSHGLPLRGHQSEQSVIAVPERRYPANFRDRPRSALNPATSHCRARCLNRSQHETGGVGQCNP